MRAYAQSGQYHTIVESRVRLFGESQSKTMRAYAQSGQYHTIVESRVRLTRQTHNCKTYNHRGSTEHFRVDKHRTEQ